VAIVVVVVIIVSTVVVIVVVVIAMIFVIPVAFVHLPATLIVVVVGVGPVGAGIGRPLPCTWNPDIVAAARHPVPIDPDEAFRGHGRRDFIADWWRRGSDVDLDLAECRDCQGRCSDETT
jgi:hypothetical protein